MINHLKCSFSLQMMVLTLDGVRLSCLFNSLLVKLQPMQVRENSKLEKPFRFNICLLTNLIVALVITFAPLSAST